MKNRKLKIENLRYQNLENQNTHRLYFKPYLNTSQTMRKQPNPVSIIAGPDSLDDYNIQEVYQIAEIPNPTGLTQKAILGTRTVGLKSRTNFDEFPDPKNFMGWDHEIMINNMKILSKGGKLEDCQDMPSIVSAKEIYQKTGMLCSSEVMLPYLQTQLIQRYFAKTPFMLWNPAVDQLGWHLQEMAMISAENGWSIGLKNGKWIGETYELCESEEYTGQTSLETAWQGLYSYSQGASDRIFIQRGVDVPNKENWRNLPAHQASARVKKRTGAKMYFDPSHSMGPKMRDEIVDYTTKAMQMPLDKQNFENPESPYYNQYLYDGVLIEVGTAKCDTYQHITVDELKTLVQKISQIREIWGR